MQRTAAGLVALLLVCWGTGSGVEARVHRLGTTEQITTPRFAEADLDGDGADELVVGGRVGRFRAVTDPFGSREARIEVHVAAGGSFDLRAASANLHVVTDVAAADLDADGRAEIIAVGDFRIYVLEYDRGELVVRHEETLATGRLLSVDAADLDGDGRAEIAVAESRPETGAEARVADIRVYAYASDGALVEEGALGLSQSVGDLCLGDFDGDGSGDLVLEQGSEEIGGLLGMYGFVDLQPYERFTSQVTREHARALSLAAGKLGAGALLGVGDIRGRVMLLQPHSHGFTRVHEVSLPRQSGVLHGLHLTRLLDGTHLQTLSGTAPMGARQAQLWVVGD